MADVPYLYWLLPERLLGQCILECDIVGPQQVRM